MGLLLAGAGDKGHGRCQGTCLLVWVSLYWWDCLHESQASEASGKILSSADLAWAEGDQVRVYLNKQGIWWLVPMKAEGPGWCHGKATLNYLWEVIAIRGDSWGEIKVKSQPCLQERLEGISWDDEGAHWLSILTLACNFLTISCPSASKQ